MFRHFIERPVKSSVIAIIIVILGLISIHNLPIEQYPDIAPPTVRVSATYTGANAETVLKSVVIPLEEQINGVENMIYMSSTASNSGTASIDVYFKQGSNPDMAAVNVQNRVAQATGVLPAEVTRVGVTTMKRQTSMLLILSIYSENPNFDETFIQNYCKINLIPQIQRVQGVGDAMVWSAKTYSMRIWLKPDVMAAYKLVPSDITAALNEQNLEAAPGKFGELNNQSFEYTIKYKGKLTLPSEYENIVIKADDKGNILRLKDVARVEFGSLAYTADITTLGHPGVTMAVIQTSGSNARQVIIDVKKVIAEAEKTFPSGVKIVTLVDNNVYLNSSIHKVVKTLFEAFLLVCLVVFMFLQNFRATIIPSLSVPVAIIGAFFFLNMFGFTINMLTLFALLLAIGIVVDDAIVVVEAVHAKLEHGEKNTLEAASSAMNEISGAIITITLVMSAVFVPVTFITGTTGVFYKQFGITLACAIIISACIALTLSPALCALFLKPYDEKSLHGKGLIKGFYRGFNAGYSSFSQKYQKLLNTLIHRKWIVFVVILVFSVLLLFLMKTTPKGFIPSEDKGAVFVDISLPPATSLAKTTEVTQKLENIIANIPEMRAYSRIIGNSFLSGSGSSYAMFICELKPYEERKGKAHSVDSVIARLYGMTAGFTEARILFFTPGMVPGFGLAGGFELKVEDRTGGDIKVFEQNANKFLSELRKYPEIQYASTAFNTNFPQYQVDVNGERCKQSGISVSTVLSAMQGYIGGYYASDFNRFGKQYRVMLQAEPKYRGNPEDMNGVFVKTASGEMAPITEFVTFKRIYGPENLTRFNMYTSISVNGAPNPGYSSGQAIDVVRKVAAQTLPRGYTYEFSGSTREEVASGGQSLVIFLLSLIFVYFLLCAQYESFILPFSIILTLPIGIAGSFLFAKFMGVENNIYLQISLIMLIGLLSKNAILIVEFARQRRHSGMSIIESAVEGARVRLRPILMTSLSFIVSLLPLVFSSGIGANGNRSIGIGAVGGMLVGTMIGILVIPVLYVIFENVQEFFGKPATEEISAPENRQN
ncbi:MAG: efflux RND transporter permease subunit [Candidatus Latescibacterota bacterium]